MARTPRARPSADGGCPGRGGTRRTGGREPAPHGRPTGDRRRGTTPAHGRPAADARPSSRGDRPAHGGRSTGSVAASAAHRAARAEARQDRSHGRGTVRALPGARAHRDLMGPGTRRRPSSPLLRSALGRPAAPMRVLLWAAAAVAVTAVALVASCMAGNAETARLAPARTATMSAAAAGPHDLLQGAASTAAAASDLTQAVSAIQDRGDTVGWYLCTTDGTVISAHNEDTAYYAASAIKGPYVLSVLSDGGSGAPGALSGSVASAIVDSDNNSYYRVKSAFGTDRINEWLEAAGSAETLDEDVGSYVDLTPRQLAGLWVQAYPYIQAQDAEGDTFAASVFSEPANSVIPSLEGVTASWSKPGWIAVESESSTVNAGVVERGDTAYVIAVMTDDGDDFERLDRVVVALDAIGRLAVTEATGPEAAGRLAVTEATGQVAVTEAG